MGVHHQSQEPETHRGRAQGHLEEEADNIGNELRVRKAIQTNEAQADGYFNIAANIFGNASEANRASVTAIGLGNRAFNIGGNGNSVFAAGLLNTALNLAGDDIRVEVIAGFGLDDPGFSTAFNVFGNNNEVSAMGGRPFGGPFAVAGAIGKSKSNGPNAVSQSGPGINIKR